MRRHVLHDDGAQEPVGHGVAGAGDADPARRGGRIRAQPGDQPDTTADLLHDRVVASELRVDVVFVSRLEERAFVGRSTGHRQIAEAAPDRSHATAPSAAELQPGGSHGDRLHARVLLIGCRQERLEPAVEALHRVARFVGHRLIVEGQVLNR